MKTLRPFLYISISFLFLLFAGCNQDADCPEDHNAIDYEAEGFTSLFNGEDLTGRIIPEGDNGHWKVVDGVIDYDALSEAEEVKDLLTDNKYEDYELYVAWRWKEVRPDEVPIVLPDGNYAMDP